MIETKTQIIKSRQSAMQTRALLLCSGVSVAVVPLDAERHPAGADHTGKQIRVRDSVIAVWQESGEDGGGRFTRLMALELRKHQEG